MKPFLFTFFLLLLISCNNDDTIRSVDCSAISCFAETFTIELVDSTGNNLIENGTYDRELVKVFKDDLMVGGVSDNQEFNNQIFFTLSGEGNTNFEIRLNEDETDLLTLDLFINRVFECCPPDYEVNNAIYNGESQTILEGPSSGSQKITVIK